MQKRTAVIGGGISGLVASCYLAKQGFSVDLFEKNNNTGGRVNSFEANGFLFDMGPSWYWMPEVFEQFFNHFGKKTSDYFDLVRLDPSYRIFFENGLLDVPANYELLKIEFEKLEPGSGSKLDLFIIQAKRKYEIGMNRFARKPSLSLAEFMSFDLLLDAIRLQVFTPMSKHVRSYFKNPKLIQLLEFPVLFLGAMPDKIPAMYSMMNYADIVGGTWYPMGGMQMLTNAMTSLAKELGVKIHTSAQVESIAVNSGTAQTISVNGTNHSFDAIIGAADYHHIESALLNEKDRSYSKKYWLDRTMSPSCLLFFIGISKKIKNLEHHNLFFDTDFEQHSREIYNTNNWPKDPLFYVCCPSKTDPTVAPMGKENLFVLIPVAPGLESDEKLRDTYFSMIIKRIEKHTGDNIASHVEFKQSFAHEDFISNYNAFRGNAYGLANTLKQTAFLKPRMRSNKVKNLFYAGQLTVPGPGMPPAVVSGELAAQEATKYLQKLPTQFKK